MTDPFVIEVATDEQYARAGASARAWFARSEAAFRGSTTREQRELENELLDGALMDAGIIPAELPERIEQYSVHV